jgi:hypothetical protein
MTTKSVLLAEDDEPTVLQAIERDLRREYSADFWIVCTAGRQWLSRSRRLFHLFPKCNPPCVQVCHVFTCYAHSMAARLGPVSPPCNARGPATPTAVLVGLDSSWNDPSSMKRDGASGSHSVGYAGDPF